MKKHEIMDKNMDQWKQIPAGTVVYSRGERLLKLASQLHTFNVDDWFVVQLSTGTIHHFSRFIDLGEERSWLSHEEMQAVVRVKVKQELGEEYSSAISLILDKIEERRTDDIEETEGDLG